ncbi:MAG: hypothetical protein ABWW69_01775 [Pyrodictiaceae archaeon]
MILEAGSIYYDLAGGGWTYYGGGGLPFYPWKPGDRLEYYPGYLLFVRDDDTNEAWFIPIG